VLLILALKLVMMSIPLI